MISGIIYIIIMIVVLWVIHKAPSWRKKSWRTEEPAPKTPKPKLWIHDGERCCGNCNDYGGINEGQEPEKSHYCIESAKIVKRYNVCRGFNWEV